MAADNNYSYTVRLLPWASIESNILKSIRFQVFVEEQKVPEEMELDDIDDVAVHALAETADGRPCGTARLFADPGDPMRGHIGRMAVLKEFRGSGCGRALMSALLKEARRTGYSTVVLSAQCHAIPFYQKFQFTPVGGIYDDAGIDHQLMVLRLP